MKPKILIADNEQMFAEAVAYVLEQAGFEPIKTSDSRTALYRWKEEQPALCILSESLPSVTQYRLCCELRGQETSGFHPPILMLGTDTLEETRVVLLECGADDYMAKPFGMKEFMARIYALLRRAKVPLESLKSEEVRSGGFILNAVNKKLVIQGINGERSVSLTPKESHILHALMDQTGTVVTREVLVERIWGQIEDQPGAFNALDVHMRALRRKIEKDADNPEHITVVRGVGFIFEP